MVNIEVSEYVKAMLEKVKKEEHHKSIDSVIRLALDRDNRLNRLLALSKWTALCTVMELEGNEERDVVREINRINRIVASCARNKKILQEDLREIRKEKGG